MFKPTLCPIRLGVLLCGGLLVPSLPAAEPNSASAAVSEAQTEDLHPFTHIARIPANADLGSIRLEGISRVHVPAWIKHTAGPNYCAEVTSRDPGGSMLCPSTATVVNAVAYQVTYSYTARPMASDEFANRRFEFRVYFRNNELPPLDRGDAAGSFTVNTYREPVRRVSIDSTRSVFCPGAYQDGVWTNNDKSCQDDIRYTATAAPSDYMTVKVEYGKSGQLKLAAAR